MEEYTVTIVGKDYISNVSAESASDAMKIAFEEYEKDKEAGWMDEFVECSIVELDTHND